MTFLQCSIKTRKSNNCLTQKVLERKVKYVHGEKTTWKTFDGVEHVTPEQAIKYVENELQIFFDTLLLKAMENTNISFHAEHVIRTSLWKVWQGALKSQRNSIRIFSFMLYGDGKHMDEHIEDEDEEEGEQ